MPDNDKPLTPRLAEARPATVVNTFGRRAAQPVAPQPNAQHRAEGALMHPSGRAELFAVKAVRQDAQGETYIHDGDVEAQAVARRNNQQVNGRTLGGFQPPAPIRAGRETDTRVGSTGIGRADTEGQMVELIAAEVRRSFPRIDFPGVHTMDQLREAMAAHGLPMPMVMTAPEPGERGQQAISRGRPQNFRQPTREQLMNQAALPPPPEEEDPIDFR